MLTKCEGLVQLRDSKQEQHDTICKEKEKILIENQNIQMALEKLGKLNYFQI